MYRVEKLKCLACQMPETNSGRSAEIVSNTPVVSIIRRADRRRVKYATPVFKAFPHAVIFNCGRVAHPSPGLPHSVCDVVLDAPSRPMIPLSGIDVAVDVVWL